jgi:hypothetical protein
MEDNFLSARLESTRVRNYLGKQLKNKSARKFIECYIDSEGELTPDLKKATFMYKRMDSLQRHHNHCCLHQSS